MSNLEKHPAEVLLDDSAVDSLAGDGERMAHAVEILEPREVPLGGPRAMTVRRTLPQRGRSLIGSWCFVDHYGPDDVTASAGMVVPPHPHTGLQTVSWLFSGEIEHRDSAEHHAFVVPGELNLMTAGSGIQHSEVSTPRTRTLHGAQLWIALPDASRHTDPGFEHYAPAPVAVQDAEVRVFLGSLAGVTSPVPTFHPLVGAEILLPAGGGVELEVDEAWEHGVLVDSGILSLNGVVTTPSRLAFAPAGERMLVLRADTAARVLLIGGEPLREEIVMWWNFIGRSHDEIVKYRQQWQTEVIAGRTPDGRFGAVVGYPGDALPAPELPAVRLRPRR